MNRPALAATLDQPVPTATSGRRFAALAEIAVMAALLLSYIWGWQGAFPFDFHLVATLYFGFGIWSQLRRGETWSDVGIRVDNLGSAFRVGGILIAPLLVAPVFVGSWLGTENPFMLSQAFGSIAWSFCWGTMQQYGVVCFFYRRAREVLPGEWSPMLVGAGFFALFHLPNPFLTPVTLLTGVVACWIYRREPNVFALGLLHALLSFAIRQSIDPSVTHRMRVGPGFWRV